MKKILGPDLKDRIQEKYSIKGLLDEMPENKRDGSSTAKYSGILNNNTYSNRIDALKRHPAVKTIVTNNAETVLEKK